MSAPDATAPEDAVLRAGEAARLVGGRLEGDADLAVRGVAPLDQAEADELGLLAARRYLENLSGTRAGGLLVSTDLLEAVSGADRAPDTRIVVDDPYRALPPLLERLHPPRRHEPGVHPTAILGAGVELGDDVSVGPYAVVGDDVSVGEGVRIGSHAVVGRGSRIGARSVLHPQVVLYPGSVLGRRVVLHAGVRVGVDGFGYVTVEGDRHKVPQVGSCVLGDDVEVGANCTLDRGSIGRTEIGEGTKLDNLVHLGHNVRVGRSAVLVAQVGVAGSTRLGDEVMCGGQAGISGHLDVGDGARIAAQAGVIGDVEEGETVSGYPARNHREYLRGMALMLKLPEMRRRLRELEERLDASGESASGPG